MEKVLKATHQGELPIGNIKLPCAVLEDGTRVISKSAVFKAFGRSKRGRNIGEVRVPNMPAFLDANNLQSFVGEDLIGVLKQIDYIGKNDKTLSSGYNALILPLICKVYLDARSTINEVTKKPFLVKSQEPLARASEIVLISLSKVGIIALIDEATGYQYTREKDELQKILQAYISPELLPWQKRFPDEFYKEIFRLNGWDYTVSGIKKRPGIIGTWTKNLVYNLLPSGVLQKLEDVTPKNATGKKIAKMHQSLTLDIGEPHLEKQLISVITLMNISNDWKEFEKHFVKKFYKELISLPPQKRVKTQHKTLEQTSLFDGVDIDLLFPRIEDVVEGNNDSEPIKEIGLFDSQLKGLLNVPPPNKDK